MEDECIFTTLCNDNINFGNFTWRLNRRSTSRPSGRQTVRLPERTYISNSLSQPDRQKGSVWSGTTLAPAALVIVGIRLLTDDAGPTNASSFSQLIDSPILHIYFSPPIWISPLPSSGQPNESHCRLILYTPWTSFQTRKLASGSPPSTLYPYGRYIVAIPADVGKNCHVPHYLERPRM